MVTAVFQRAIEVLQRQLVTLRLHGILHQQEQEKTNDISHAGLASLIDQELEPLGSAFHELVAIDERRGEERSLVIAQVAGDLVGASGHLDRLRCLQLHHGGESAVGSG